MQKKILIVAPVACFPPVKGNAARIASVYEQLISRGFDVHYCHIPDSAFDAAEMKHKLGDNYFYQNYNPFSRVRLRLAWKALRTILGGKKFRIIKVDDFLAAADIAFYKQVLNKVRPDTVWINYTFYSKLFNVTPANVLKILDTHDSIYLRFNSIFNDKKGYKNFKIDLADEISCINRADEVVCIQPEETAFIKDNGCTKNLYTIGHIGHFTPTTSRQQRTTLLFLANDYFIYVDAIKSFINNIWPQLKVINPDVQLFIAGMICRKLEKYEGDAGITLLGIVDELKGLYDEADVIINPVYTGSGLKIKVIEALNYGKPVVTTPSGLSGLEKFKGNGLIVADTAEQWITQINTLLTDKTYYNAQILDLRATAAQNYEHNIAIFEKLFQKMI